MIDVIVVCPLTVIGLIGNCLSVIVLRRDSSINYTTSLLLGAIALIDNVYLVSCLLYQTFKAVCYIGPPAFTGAPALDRQDNASWQHGFR